PVDRRERPVAGAAHRPPIGRLSLTLTLAIGTSPAQASVSAAKLYDNLGTTTLYTTPWYEGGGSCATSGDDATRERAGNP
ncbi:MAG: hypothetical protein QOI98_1864, partial [Solirubrobacteraceae bacterium]|nr:hypothetical protein [Solirubrobacteraceae bacterium]